jgi:Flp pilus assembly pilin Flp
MCPNTPAKRVCNMSGVTMTQFALILTAIAVGVYASYATYRMLGSNIGSLASGVDSDRSAAQGTPIPPEEKP